MGGKARLWMKWGMMILIIRLVVIQTEAYGNSWKWELFLRGLDCDCYYDPDTVIKLPQNVIRVWWKEVFKSKEVLKSRGFTRSQYEQTAYQINVTEINCKTKESFRKFFMLCSGEGESILCTIHRLQSNEWTPIREDHATGVLYLKLCQ